MRRQKRVRRGRPPTMAGRATNLLLNPRLRRRERFERIAIAVAIVLAAIYLLASPFLSRYFQRSDGPAPAVQTKPAAGKKSGMQN